MVSMKKPLPEPRYPSVEEFVGWYNLGYDRRNGYPVLHSRERVPDFLHGDFVYLCRKEYRWFEKLVPLWARKPFDPVDEPPFYLRCSADDRTLDVDANPDYVTVDIVRRMQRVFLRRYPLWRIILCLDIPSCAISIYPDAVRYGNFPLGVDPHKALKTLLPRAAAAWEKRSRAQRLEVEFLQERLPEAIRQIGKRRHLVLGTLHDRNRKVIKGRLAVHLLIRGDKSTAVDVEGPPNAEKQFLWSGNAYAVNDKGSITSYGEPPKSAPFCVKPWFLPADYRGPLTIIERATGERHQYIVKSRDIVRVDCRRPIPGLRRSGRHMLNLQTRDEGVLLPVHAQPGAGKNAVVGIHAGRLKVAVTQAPEKGKANQALIEVLAKALRVKKSKISLVAGATASHKQFLVTGLSPAVLQVRVDALLVK